MIGVADDANREHKDGDALNKDSASSATGGPPFSRKKAPQVRGDNRHGHHDGPSHRSTERAQPPRLWRVTNKTYDPQQAHQRSQNPATASPGLKELVRCAVLSQQPSAVGRVANEKWHSDHSVL